MVHANFIWKQLNIYLKIIFLASIVVYVLSIIVSFIPVGGSDSFKRKNERKDTAGVKSALVGKTEKIHENYEKSFIGRWTALAKDIFANAGQNLNSEIQGKLNVHRWYSICGNTVDNLRRHILFPKHPKLRTSINASGFWTANFWVYSSSFKWHLSICCVVRRFFGGMVE